MSRPDPLSGGEPVFREPWEAEAFALAVKLHEHGLFTGREWAETLGAQIRCDPAMPYYEQWLAALETLVEAKHVLGRDERLTRIEEWREAARRTPHGQPIELGASSSKLAQSR